MNKFLLSFLIIVLLSVLLTSCGIKPEVKAPVRIALNVWPGYAHAFVADKYFFDKNGVDVQLVLTETYEGAQKLYLDGKVDGIFEVFSDTILHNSKGVQTKVVYVADYSNISDVIVGRSEFGSLSDLNGKKLGIVNVNGFSNIFVLKLLEHAGLKEGQFEFAVVSALDVVDALDSGVIDAGHTWEPTLSVALRKGYRVLGFAGEISGVITDVLVFDAGFIEQRPDDVRKVVKSLLDARDYVHSNRNDALQVMSSAEAIGEAELVNGLNGIVQLDLGQNKVALVKSDNFASLYFSGSFIIDFLLNHGQLGFVPELSQVIDARFVNAVEVKK